MELEILRHSWSKIIRIAGWISLILIIFITILFSQKAYSWQHNEQYPPPQTHEEYLEEAWMEFKEDNPTLYYIIRFFNPPILNNILAYVITVMFAVSSFMIMSAFEGSSKIIVILLSLYAWGRIICLFIGFLLINKGVLPPM